MSDSKTLDLIKRCKVELAPGDTRSWGIRINKIDDPCLDALKNISNKMGPENRMFLGKRLIAETPDIEKILKELKLKK